MRSLYVALGLALCSANTLAADFGIGVSARSDDGFLYVPINVSKTFRVEPSLRYASSELTITQDTFEDTRETDTWELGVGVFGLKQITDSAHLYYGARLAYVESETTSTELGPFGQPFYTESTQDGYRIGPTLGFEYLFGAHFSVGGEVSYSFLDIEGETTIEFDDIVGPRTVAEIEQKSSGTQTRLIFRYMF